jgi:hypothetical protein
MQDKIGYIHNLRVNLEMYKALGLHVRYILG